MRYLTLAFILLFAGCNPAVAADSSACYVIANADARAYCLAETRKDASMCYAIQDSAMRARCMAEVR